MRGARKAIPTLAAVVALAAVCSACESRTIVAEGPTPVYSRPICFPRPADSTDLIHTLEVGGSARAIDFHYPKECMLWEIELEDGREGFIRYGDPFRVERR